MIYFIMVSKQYERLEFSLKEFQSADRVVLSLPDGSEECILPFVFRPIDVFYDELGYEHITAKDSYLKFRYTPKQTGRYEFRVYSGDKLLDTFTIMTEKSDMHGYVKVSERDGRYFEYSDKTPFIPIGINAVRPNAYPISDGKEFGITGSAAYIGLRQYERWFKKCRKNGVNVVRLWCGDEYFNPDGDDVGSLRYEQFTKLDLLVKLAEKYQIKLKLTFEHFRYFSSDGKAPKIFEKELAQNGVSCKSMTEWLTDPKWKDAWVLKINEFAKRYAGDVNFFAFEFWNEMNCVDADFDSVIEWNREMADRARVLFPDNMVINSLGSFDCSSVERQYQKFPWEAFSFKQIHSYLDSGAEKEVCRHSLIELMADNFKKNQPESCPVVVAETGAVNNCHSGPFRFYVSDDNGIIFADAVFTPFFLGSADCGNIWHWSDYVEAKGLFKMYKPFYKLTRDIDFARESFVSRDMSDENVYALILEGKNHILAYIRNRKDNWENSLRDQKDLKGVSVDLKIGGYSDVKLYRIWDDKIKAKKYSDGVRLSGIIHGLFLKFIT